MRVSTYDKSGRIFFGGEARKGLLSTVAPRLLDNTSGSMVCLAPTFKEKQFNKSEQSPQKPTESKCISVTIVQSTTNK